MTPLTLRLFMTPEFLAWHDSLDEALFQRVAHRLELLKSGHFGDSRSLGDGLFELKWRMGLRVYFTRKRIGAVDSIILHGGFKGTQAGDIALARALQARHERAHGGGHA
mgnify:CR=1 FL=1